jgi:hypothetical protein
MMPEFNKSGKRTTMDYTQFIDEVFLHLMGLHVHELQTQDAAKLITLYSQKLLLIFIIECLPYTKVSNKGWILCHGATYMIMSISRKFAEFRFWFLAKWGDSGRMKLTRQLFF